MQFTEVALKSRAAWAAFAIALALGACDGSGETGSGASATGSTATGSTSGGGGAGGESFAGRRCGMGAPCSAGATCEYSGIESGVKCTCDPSGHFLCDPWASGGAPPFSPCDMESACDEGEEGEGGGGGAGGADGGSCSLGNGWCTRTCTCVGGCEVECMGNPPASEEGHLCNGDYCSLDYWGNGGCEVKDGACDYKVECGNSPTITGTCPDSK